MDEKFAKTSPIWISLSTKATGESPSKHALIELGVCVLEQETRQVIVSKKWEIKKPNDKTWDQKYLHEFWFNPFHAHHDKLKEIYERVERGEGQEGRLVAEEFDALLVRLEAKFSKHRLFFLTSSSSADCTKINYFMDTYNYRQLHMYYGSFRDVVSTDIYELGYYRVPFEYLIKQLERETPYMDFFTSDNSNNAHKIAFFHSGCVPKSYE